MHRPRKRRNMSEENKRIQQSKKRLQINDLLMKPFSLGWTREVVMRVITKNRAPNCDIYYFSPSKKRIRSLTELKSILTDGLSPECFSFKREPLGLTPDLEIIRDAKVRGKKPEKCKEKGVSELKKSDRPNNLEDNDDNDVEIKKQKTETKKEVSETEDEKKENKDKPNMKKNKEVKDIKNELGKDPETRSKRIKHNEIVSTENNKFNNKKKTKRKVRKPAAPVKLKSVKQRKNILNRMMSAKQAKQANVVASKKILKKIVRKIVTSQNEKLSKKKNKRDTALKGTKNKKVKLKTGKIPLKNSLIKTKNEIIKESESNETDKKSASRDLKSIVKKNIGKYREMREKQKLGVVKSQARSTSKKTTSASVTRTRSEPISKNKLFYLKPLEKGWRRELVYRSNCARAGQRADVYYFHPSGKKLRSCREIAENLTHGLSIEYFTFKKEPIGCGEPSEVVRSARFIQKN